jgi:DNA-binding Lrp family transcriptional regulator
VIKSDVEERILATIQRGLPRVLSPYEAVAKEAGVEVGQLLSVLREWKASGKLRRIGAVVNHFKAGLGVGAMIVWRVEADRIEKVGALLASFPQVSHAYERETTENWTYNLYTMVHAADTEQLQRTVESMSEAAGVKDFKMLMTEKELKKVPPTYIIDR